MPNPACDGVERDGYHRLYHVHWHARAGRVVWWWNVAPRAEGDHNTSDDVGARAHEPIERRTVIAGDFACCFCLQTRRGWREPGGDVLPERGECVGRESDRDGCDTSRRRLLSRGQDEAKLE